MVGTFPDRAALIQLVGAAPEEQHDEWIEDRRRLGRDVLACSRTDMPADSVAEDTQEVTPAFTADLPTRNHATTSYTTSRDSTPLPAPNPATVVAWSVAPMRSTAGQCITASCQCSAEGGIIETYMTSEAGGSPSGHTKDMYA